jgi:tripartite-type tricarboxylate transporter receptor subunit TctC
MHPSARPYPQTASARPRGAVGSEAASRHAGRVGRRVLALALLACASLSSHAQSIWPERPVRLVVPFPAGGTVDLVARVVAQNVAPTLRQPVVVENRAGGAGSIGADAVARATPDGHLLLMGTASTHGTNPAVQKALPYDAVKSFAPVALVASTPYILVAHPDLPAKSVAELLALARAQPGRIDYGSYGNGSSNHLATELVRAITGIDVVHVPYKGGAPALAALLAGEVKFMFDVFTTSESAIRAGKLRLLAVAAPRRARLAPDVPTLAEAGIAGAESGTFFGIFAPAGTPREIVERLNAAINRAVVSPEVAERLAALGAEGEPGPPEALGRLVAIEVARWTRLVRERDLRFEP